MNFYKKTFKNRSGQIDCDFSVLVPSWKFDSSVPWSSDLFKSAIEYAEQKQYYGFYTVVDSEHLEDYLKFIKSVAGNYLVIVEESIPHNEKPINILFWNWLFSSVSRDYETCVINHILPGELRSEQR
jgi:hypothetical protein